MHIPNNLPEAENVAHIEITNYRYKYIFMAVWALVPLCQVNTINQTEMHSPISGTKWSYAVTPTHMQAHILYANIYTYRVHGSCIMNAYAGFNFRLNAAVASF